MRTLYRRIRAFGLVSYIPRLVLPLTAEHRQRLNWCRLKQHWKAEWRNVVFCDELRFCLGMHDDRKKVRYHRGEWRDIRLAVERHGQRTVGVMALRAFAYANHLFFYLRQRNSWAFCWWRPTTHFFALSRGPSSCFFFQQDKTCSHIARRTTDLL